MDMFWEWIQLLEPIPTLTLTQRGRSQPILRRRYTAPAPSAEAGIVTSQAQIILRATPQRTVPAPIVAPDPMTLPLTTWVVLTGIPRSDELIIVAADAVSIE